MYCPLPFNHLSIEPNGGVSPCRNTSATKVIGNSNEASLMELFESEELKSFRKNFLDKESPLPPECYQCQKLEEAGNISLRQTAEKMYSDTTRSEENKTIRYLGFRFDNTCNLKCRICFPNLSSAWVADYKSLGRGIPQMPLRAFSSKESFLEQVEVPLKTVTEIYIAGGEPFLSPRFYDMIEAIKLIGRESEIELDFNTNGTITEYKGKSLQEYLEGFKKITFGVSLDGVGKQTEYLRHGVKWEVFDKTIRTYQSWENCEVAIAPTLGNLNLFYLPELLTYCLKDLKLEPRLIVLGPIFEPAHFRTSQLPEEFKPELHKKLLTYGLEIINDSTIKGSMTLFQQIKGMIHLSKTSFDKEIHKEFLKEVKAIDEIRGESFNEVFPELAAVLDKL